MNVRARVHAYNFMSENTQIHQMHTYLDKGTGLLLVNHFRKSIAHLFSLHTIYFPHLQCERTQCPNTYFWYTSVETGWNKCWHAGVSVCRVVCVVWCGMVYYKELIATDTSV